MYKVNEELEEKIKNQFKGKSIAAVQFSSIKKFIEINPEIKEYLEYILKVEPLYESILAIVQHILFGFNLAKCKTCGKMLPWKQRKNEFCSKKCSMTNPTVIEKRKNTVKEKFGTEFFYQSEEFKKRRRQSLINHYGIDDPLKSSEVWDSIKKKYKEKYGVEYFNQTKEFIEKRKNTWKEKYGNSIPMQTEECKNKRIDTSLKKYGVKNPQILHKWNTIQSFKDYIIPLFNKEELEASSEKIYKWKCVKCGNIFEQRIYNTNHLKEIGEQVPRCLKCFPLNLNYSKKEKEVLEFCKEHFTVIEENNRTLIYPFELDIYIPEIKLGIEFDGDYWHQEGKTKPVRISSVKR